MNTIPSQHWNILVSNENGKEKLIEQLTTNQLIPDLWQRKIELYSSISIGKYIREEDLHDIFMVSNERGQTLRSMSSGERKKALFAHIISNKPDVIILDNPLDSLDQQARADLTDHIASLSPNISFINIVGRTRDFILDNTEDYVWKNDQLVPFSKQTEIQSSTWLKGDVPQPIDPIKLNEHLLIDMQDVSVSYGERAILNKINWQISKGEFWQLRGPNGAGKTTLLTMITGDNPKAFGQNIKLFGYQKGSGESVWDIKRNIGYYTSTMIHDFWRNQSILQMVISGYHDTIGQYRSASELELRRGELWLSLIDLIDKKDKPFLSLPVGWQRLVLIIRAMVKHPPLLILDEPTSDLDDENAARMVSLINKIARESETAILYVSHQDEPGLEPDLIYELKAQESGSVGTVVRP